MNNKYTARKRSAKALDTKPNDLTMPVDAEEMYYVNHMAARETCVRACMSFLVRSMNLDGFKFKGSGKDSIYESPGVRDEYVVPFMRDYIHAVIQFGFACVDFREVVADGSQSEEWMAKNKKPYDKAAEAGTWPANDYSVKVVVPFVSPYGTWTAKVEVPVATRFASVRCFSTFKPDGSAEQLELMAVNSLHALIPRVHDGRLQSTLGSLVVPWTQLEMVSRFEVDAQRTMSAPTTAIQLAETEDVTKRMYEEEFSGRELGETKQAITYKTIHEAYEKIDVARKQFADRIEDGTRDAFVSNSDPSVTPEEYVHPIKKSMFVVPSGFEMASPQPVMPVPPANVGERTERFFNQVCDAFGLPKSILGSAKAQGGGGAREVSSNDLALLTETLAAVRRDVELATAKVFRVVAKMCPVAQGIAGVELTPTVYPDMETVTELFLQKCISPPDYDAIFANVYGIEIKTKHPPVETTASSSSSGGTKKKKKTK